MNITCKQIAEMVGVSRQAVYSVLREKSVCLVSPEKKEKILFLAKAYHYQPNVSAISLNGKSTFLIGAVIDSFWDIDGRLLSVLNSKMQTADYRINASTIISIAQGVKMIDTFIASGADAVVIAGNRLKIDPKNYSVPILSLGREVGTDYYLGAKQITEHLIQVHGHTKILHIASEDGSTPKYRGYCDAMTEAGLKPLPILPTIQNLGFSEELHQYLSQGVTAIETCGDDHAAPLIHYLRCRGVRVPEDVAVTGFNGFGDHPEVSTVVDPVEKVADLAFHVLMKKIRMKTLEMDTPHWIVPELQPSLSCGCPPLRFDNIAREYSMAGCISK